MCPSADRTDTEADNDLVFFMSNIMQQNSINNSGVWAQFEGYCRALAQTNELLIVCGPSGFGSARINTNGPAFIPSYVWKIAVVVPPGEGPALGRITDTTRVIALKIPNTDAATNTWPFYVTSANEIQVETGFTFFTTLPGDVAAALRNKVDGQTNPPPVIFSFAPTNGAANTNVVISGTNFGSATAVTFNGASAVSTAGTAAAQAWGGVAFTNSTASGAIASNKFVTFSITVNAAYKVSCTSVNRFDYRRSSGGAANGVLQFQVDEGAFVDITNLAYSSTSASGSSIGAIDLSEFPGLQNVGAGTNVTFRIVNYGGTSASGTWYISDVAGSTAPDLALQGMVTSVAAPTLSIARMGANLVLSWPSSYGGFILQQKSNLSTTNWINSNIPVGTNGTMQSATNSLGTGNLFFRLYHP